MSSLYILAKITQFLSVIGFGMIIFGIFFSRIFIRVVYTEKWATDVILIINNLYYSLPFKS